MQKFIYKLFINCLPFFELFFLQFTYYISKITPNNILVVNHKIQNLKVDKKTTGQIICLGNAPLHSPTNPQILI